MNILITGSSGFLGRSLKGLLNSDHSIFDLPKIDSLNGFRLDKNVPIFNQNFDLVIHCAGKAHSNPTNKLEAKKFFEVNVTGTENLLKGLCLSGIPKQFIFVSSVAVYGLEEGTNISEMVDLTAKDPYGLSKIQAEQLVQSWCYKNNVICTTLRLPLLVGKNPPGNLGAMLKAIKNGYYFNVGGGGFRKSMVLIEDVAKFIPLIAPVGGIYNLTDGYHPSLFDLSKYLAKNRVISMPFYLAKILSVILDVFGEKAPINTKKLKKLTSHLTFNDSKARELGWNPQNVLDYLKKNDL